MPVTTPRMRRLLIAARNRGAGGIAGARARTSPIRLSPSFLIVGAQKAGTTFLYLELLRHSQVVPALTKEVQYFSEHFERGPDWYRGFFPSVASAARRSRIGGKAHGQVICGDATPEYMFHPLGPARIAKEMPDAKIIVLLRDPVRRAFSQYQHERRLGYESAPTFSDALALEARRTEGEWDRMASEPSYVSYPLFHHAYRLRGHYAEQLRCLYEQIDPDRVKVIIAEEFYADSCNVVEDLVNFLGITPWRPATPGQNDMEAKTGSMPADARRELSEYFASHNRDLAAMLGRELPWAGMA